MPSPWVSSKWGSRSLQTVCASTKVLKANRTIKMLSRSRIYYNQHTICNINIKRESKTQLASTLKFKQVELESSELSNTFWLCCKLHFNPVKRKCLHSKDDILYFTLLFSTSWNMLKDEDINFEPPQRGHEWYKYEKWVTNLNPDHTAPTNITTPCKLPLLIPVEALKSGGLF